MTDAIMIGERERGTRCCDSSVEPVLNTAEAQLATNDLLILAHPVCDIESAVPVKQPTVSHHLRLLRDAGLVDCERQGLWAYYFLKREALAELRARVAGQLDRLS
jgi:ArsR family transcriptional regulator, arsenate/arsenite/antimonite-responsive transcriptional repressor